MLKHLIAHEMLLQAFIAVVREGNDAHNRSVTFYIYNGGKCPQQPSF